MASDKKLMTANEYIASLPPGHKGPNELEDQIDKLLKENHVLTLKISFLETALQSARNDADNQRAIANIPRY
jgi:hypothetical protein